MKKILIIKHGSLGDIISSTGVLKCIRNHFKDSEIHLLTTKKYRDVLSDFNLFDSILIDNRNKDFLNIKLLLKIINNKYDLVIDLQNSQRTMVYSFFFRIMTSTKWNGTRFGSTIRYIYDTKNPPHVIDGLTNQIKKLGVKCYQSFYLDWLRSDYNLPDEIKNKKFFLINPGCSKNNIQKRWLPTYFAEICDFLSGRNIKPVLIGANKDKDVINDIILKTDTALNLYNLSPLNTIFSLANLAAGALSNDTGPAHLIAGTGCKLHLVLSSFSKVSKVVPRGTNVSFTQKDDINNIKPSEIIITLRKMLNI